MSLRNAGAVYKGIISLQTSHSVVHCLLCHVKEKKMPWKLQSPGVYPLPVNELTKTKLLPHICYCKPQLKESWFPRSVVSEKRKIGMSCAARTNVVLGLVMLGSSPQQTGAHCCALSRAAVLQAQLNPLLLCCKPSLTHVCCAAQRALGCPVAGQQGTSLHKGQLYEKLQLSSL